jgi:hypothetical protein
MPIYTCDACQFTTPLRSNYSNHLLTRKHLSHNPIEANMLVQMLAADSPMLATPEPVFKTQRYRLSKMCVEHDRRINKGTIYGIQDPRKDQDSR